MPARPRFFLRRWRLPQGFHQAAGSANIVLLAAVALLAAIGPGLVQERAPARPTLPPAPPTLQTARRSVVILVDALRDDVSRDAGVMPVLCELATRGGRGTARVESLIPSTVAGITTLTTGVVPGPASFFADFRASPARAGGIFESAKNEGRRTAVAGPSLWTDLLGAWIDQSPLAGDWTPDDAAVEAAGLRLLRERSADLIVIHLSMLDSTAHRFGGDSNEYRAAATSIDRQIGRLLKATNEDDCAIVTADHGVTAGGGHGGPEPSVLATPLVCAGPGMPRGEFGTLRQADAPHLIARAMSWTLLSGNLSPPRGILPTSGLAALAILAAWNAIRLLAQIAKSVRRNYTAINATLWGALAALLAGQFGFPAALAAFVLVVSGRRRPRVERAAISLVLRAAALGSIAALARWGVAILLLDTSDRGMFPNPLIAAASVAVVVVVASALSRALFDRHWLLAGTALVLVTIGAATEQLDSRLSLSHLDMSIAVRWVSRGNASLGSLIAASITVIGIWGLPIFAMAALQFAGKQCTPKRQFARIVASAAAFALGQMFTAALLFRIFRDAVIEGSLALALLLRTVFEFAGWAGVLSIGLVVVRRCRSRRNVRLCNQTKKGVERVAAFDARMS